MLLACKDAQTLPNQDMTYIIKNPSNVQELAHVNGLFIDFEEPYLDFIVCIVSRKRNICPCLIHTRGKLRLFNSLFYCSNRYMSFS